MREGGHTTSPLPAGAPRPASPRAIRQRTITRFWPDDPATRAALTTPRDDIVLEREAAGGFEQAHGPFSRYTRRVEQDPRGLKETTTYRLEIPWFGWVFGPLVRALLARRKGLTAAGRQAWWAPPDRLDQRQALVLGLLAAASMTVAFTNTLFTQTVEFAADDFGVGDAGIGWAAGVVRAGVVLALPAAILADRRGRRMVLVVLAFVAPLLSAAGALAPDFPVLVATQTLARPTGLALGVLVGVVAAEEMPRNSRAYAISVLAMASGLGAGIAVSALNLVGIGEGGWRFAYLASLLFLIIAIDLRRRMPETIRFARPHRMALRLDRRRFVLLGVVAVVSSLFVAPASIFGNSYLSDVRGYSPSLISLFTLATATPAGIGLIIGGRFADIHGRKPVIAVALPLATGFVVLSFVFGGPLMWFGAFAGGVFGAISYPALAVYRAELFPTGSRSRAVGLLTTAGLLGGIIGLVIAGQLREIGWSYGHVMGLLAIGELVVLAIVLLWYPDTAHRELEELNPLDAQPPPD